MIRFRVLKDLVADSTVTKTYEVIILEPQESTVTYAGNGHARWPIIEVPVVLRRFAHYYIVNFIIPLLCMILMAWTWLFIRREGGPGKGVGWSNFGGPVLGCIDASDSESRLIFQHFSRSIKIMDFCTAPNSTILQIAI